MAGVKRSRQHGVHRGGRPACSCPQSLHVRTQRVHGTIEAESTRAQGTVEVWVSEGRQETRRKDYIKRKTKCALRKRHRGATNMGVISCRSREASLIRKLYRLKRRRYVTAVISEQNPGDRRIPSPGWEKSLYSCTENAKTISLVEALVALRERKAFEVVFRARH